MKMPPVPAFRPMQRYAGRFWNTADVMELLSIYYGAASAVYPDTWQYRTLIAIHRSNDTTNAYRKGYGLDWKCLTWQQDKKKWVRDKGFAIKDDLLEYGRQGRVPFQALQLAATEIRKVEFAKWVNSRINCDPGSRTSVPLAAE